MRLTLISTLMILAVAPITDASAQVPLNAFGRTAADITVCPVRTDYLRFYALLDDDTHAAFAFARDHRCIELEGETTVKVDKIVGDTSCVRPSDAYDCVWTSSHRIKSLVDADTKALIDNVNCAFDKAHPECKSRNSPDYCN
jgi:hypothetical protein